MKEIIVVRGMSCKNCTDKIESALRGLGGVKEAKADLITNTVSVEYDPAKIDLDHIKSNINKLGYSTGGYTETRKKTVIHGIAYGLVPHIGCIGFIIGSVLGVTILTEAFRGLLMNYYFFHILIAISIGFATVSTAYYLKKNGLLSKTGAARKWKYISTMYGSTIGINLILFMLIFPLLANVSVAGAVTGLAVGDYSTVQLAVDIPCPGHAPLISGELMDVEGVLGVEFGFPNIFDVTYDEDIVTIQEMLSSEVFEVYKPIVIGDGSSLKETKPLAASTSGSCGGGCSGGSSCH